MQTTSLIIHVAAAAVLFGPQVLMFYAVTPASWMLANEETRRGVIKVITGRFARLTVVAIVLLLVTGLYQYFSVVPEPVRSDVQGYRFGIIFMAKMTGFVTILILIAIHVAVYGRRIGRLSDAVIAGDEEQRGALETVRSQSFFFSFVLLLVTFVTLALGVALGDESFSYAQR